MRNGIAGRVIAICTLLQYVKTRSVEHKMMAYECIDRLMRSDE